MTWTGGEMGVFMRANNGGRNLVNHLLGGSAEKEKVKTVKV